jgi:hypothetical protein
MSNDRIDIKPGASNVMIRNNYIVSPNSTAIAAHTYSSDTFKNQKKPTRRSIRNLIILNNTSNDGGTRGSFLAVYGTTPGAITLKNNLYVAPRLVMGPYSTSAIRVVGRGDLGNFTTLASGGGIDDNVWPVPDRGYQVGVQYLGKRKGNIFVTPGEWTSGFTSIVGSNEKFEKIPTSDPRALATAESNVPDDTVVRQATVSYQFGVPRPRDFEWTTGPVQM